MRALELYREGRLDEAIENLTSQVRSDPTEGRLRTFLFELLCFAGDYDRAEKQLDVLGRSGGDAAAGALVYRSALAAERARQALFAGSGLPPSTSSAPEVGGALNGSAFRSIADADERIGPRLEVFAGGQYMWIPFAHVSSVRMEAPRRLRDLLWIPAHLTAGPELGDAELGEVLLPALCAGTWGHPDPLVRLGRQTEWQVGDDGAPVPLGQKLLVVDGEEFPILEVRELSLTPVASAES